MVRSDGAQRSPWKYAGRGQTGGEERETLAAFLRKVTLRQGSRFMPWDQGVGWGVCVCVGGKWGVMRMAWEPRNPVFTILYPVRDFPLLDVSSLFELYSFSEKPLSPCCKTS